jgi:hypothetical protein
MATVPMLEGSLSCHILPSPPPPPELVSKPHRHVGFKLRVIPQVPSFDAAEDLSNDFVTFIGGTRLAIFVPQVVADLQHH